MAIDQAITVAGRSPIKMRFIGLGRFPSNPHQPPRMVFAQPQIQNLKTLPSTTNLMTTLENAMNQELGSSRPPIKFEEQGSPSFIPHLALARIKLQGRKRSRLYQLEALKELLDRHPSAELGTVDVGEVCLYQSTFTPRGPNHQKYCIRELR